jgi:hypothetical protein
MIEYFTFHQYLLNFFRFLPPYDPLSGNGRRTKKHIEDPSPVIHALLYKTKGSSPNWRSRAIQGDEQVQPLQAEDCHLVTNVSPKASGGPIDFDAPKINR